MIFRPQRGAFFINLLKEINFMKSFEYQLLCFRNNELEERVGIVVFDAETQQLRSRIKEVNADTPIGDERVKATVDYLTKELHQMEQKFSSGTPFTPFSSLQSITSQLFPENTGKLFFSGQSHVNASGIDQALYDLREEEG